MFFTLVHPHMSGFLVLVTCVQFVLGMRECVQMVWVVEGLGGGRGRGWVRLSTLACACLCAIRPGYVDCRWRVCLRVCVLRAHPDHAHTHLHVFGFYARAFALLCALQLMAINVWHPPPPQ